MFIWRISDLLQRLNKSLKEHSVIFAQGRPEFGLPVVGLWCWGEENKMLILQAEEMSQK